MSKILAGKWSILLRILYKCARVVRLAAVKPLADKNYTWRNASLALRKGLSETVAETLFNCEFRTKIVKRLQNLSLNFSVFFFIIIFFSCFLVVQSSPIIVLFWLINTSLVFFYLVGKLLHAFSWCFQFMKVKRSNACCNSRCILFV